MNELLTMSLKSPRKSSKLVIMSPALEKKCTFPLIAGSLVTILLLVTSFNMGLISTLHSLNSLFSLTFSTSVSNQTCPSSMEHSNLVASIPRFGYLISGSKGDLEKLWRTLLAVYHPLNHYIVHMDLESPSEERAELMIRIENNTVFSKVGNVYMIEKANMITYKGATMVASTLHACAILLKRSKEWDWFINLSASDYPLVTQDDILFTFANLSKDLNFIDHTSHLGWKEEKRAKPIYVDPGLYLTKKEDVIPTKERRSLPSAFKLFTGSAWMVLSRAFVEYCVWGWDNLPRTLLMYYTNVVSSPEGYFQTVICNSPEFAATVVNNDMRFILWDHPPKQHPRTITTRDLGSMIGSNAPFARKFDGNNSVMDTLDAQFLRRSNNSFTPGGWCSGEPLCSEVGDINNLVPGTGASRLQRLMHRLAKSTSPRRQCK